jgi:hypothetical protein
MTLSRFKVITATVVAVAASVLLAAPADAGKKATQEAKAVAPSPNSVKLESGVWVSKVVGTPAQWNYVATADPSGRHAAAFGTVDVAFYSQLDALIDETSPLLIDVVMTGPDTATFNSVWYGIKHYDEETALEKQISGYIVYIGVNRGTLKYTSPDRADGTHNICYYDAATADVDPADGFPDATAVPFFCPDTVYTVDTRLGQ